MSFWRMFFVLVLLASGCQSPHRPPSPERLALFDLLQVEEEKRSASLDAVTRNENLDAGAVAKIACDPNESDRMRGIALIVLRGFGGQRGGRAWAIAVSAAEGVRKENDCSERLLLVADDLIHHFRKLDASMWQGLALQDRQDIERARSSDWAPLFDLKIHARKITRPALERSLSWTGVGFVNMVVDGNLATDLESVRRDWFGFLVPMRYPGFNAQMDFVAELRERARELVGLEELHFDDLFRYADIEAEWSRLEGFIASELKRLESVPWSIASKRTAWLLGVLHHAVQDFYSHSNWVHIFADRLRYPCARIPTWEGYRRNLDEHLEAKDILESSTLETVSSDRCRGGLQTGRWRLIGPLRCGSRPAWPHLHVHREENVAIRLAKEATVEWTQKFLSMMSEERRGQLEAEVGVRLAEHLEGASR